VDLSDLANSTTVHTTVSRGTHTTSITKIWLTVAGHTIPCHALERSRIEAEAEAHLKLVP